MVQSLVAEPMSGPERSCAPLSSHAATSPLGPRWAGAVVVDEIVCAPLLTANDCWTCGAGFQFVSCLVGVDDAGADRNEAHS